MPPKRRSNAGSSAGPAKKSKTAAEAPSAGEAAGEASTASSSSSISNETRWSTKNDRYSAVSSSRNTDVDYKKATEDPEFAFTYICKCPWGTKLG